MALILLMPIQFTTYKHIYHDAHVQNISITDMVFFAFILLSDIRNAFP